MYTEEGAHSTRVGDMLDGKYMYGKRQQEASHTRHASVNDWPIHRSSIAPTTGPVIVPAGNPASIASPFL